MSHVIDKLQVWILQDLGWIRVHWMPLLVFPVVAVPWLVASQLMAPTPVTQSVPASTMMPHPSWDAPSVVFVLSSVFAGILSLMAARRSGRAEDAARATTALAAQTHGAVVAVAAKTDVIEAQGNSKATSDAAQIRALQEKLAMVIESLARAEKRAVDLAERAAPMQSIPSTIARIDEATATVAKVISEALHATPDPKG